MNLLALLERRPPPEIPPGAGRFHSSEYERRPAVVIEEGPRENNRLTKQRENRAKVLDAILHGCIKSADIERWTGLCRTSVFNHCNILEGEGLIRIEHGQRTNTYHPPKPKKSTRKVAK